MRLATGLVLLSLLAVDFGSASAGEVSPALALKMDQTAANEPLTVLVFLHDGIDVKALDLGLHTQKAGLAERHHTVIESLRNAAKAAQADLVADLSVAKNKGEILDFRPYWIVNAVRLTADKATIEAIAARAEVDVVEPNPQPVLIEPVRSRPADARTLKAGIGITPGLVNIGTRRVWEELGLRGEGTLIGSLDTGVDGTHPALADRWRGNHAPWQECWLDVLGTATEFPVDENGHGTHCTGTMTGLAPDDTIGVAPAAEWIAANVINAPPNPEFDADVIACFEWFTDPDGDSQTLDDVPDVVQNSWGINESFGYPDCDSRWWDVIDACEAAGPVVIFAAGNDGPWPSTIRSPSDRATSAYNCFAVGAAEHTAPFTIAEFSSRGPAGLNCGPEENRIKPEVSGPGVDVYSAAPDSGYVYLSGTSMATPHVCGVVALMRQANPDADVITIKEVLMGTSHDLGEPGEDNVYGHGYIDAYAAVTQIRGGFGNIEGVVIDQNSQDPVPGVQVQVVGGYGSAVTDEAGYFAFRIPAGPQIIQASAYSYETLQHPVNVPEGESLTDELVLIRRPLMTVSGTVFLPGANPVDGGTPAAGASIAIANVPEPPVTADASGQFAVALPRDTEYELTATAGIEGVLTQTVPFGADLNLDLYLNAGTAEGFESGDLQTFGWFPAGAEGWSVQGDEVHSGAWAARSAPIADGQYSQIHSLVDCGDGGEITFWFKISSESGDDVLRFDIGNDTVGEWSGEMDWTSATFPVSGGVKIIRIRYTKGSSGSSGADAAWVDDLIFPSLANPEPKLVAAPELVAVELAFPKQLVGSSYLFNMGGEDLTWTAGEAVDWLALTPTSGVIAPGAYQELGFTFDETELPFGTHTTTVTVESNDPANPVYNLQAQLTLHPGVAAAPELHSRRFALVGAVPNPFNPMTRVRFTLPENQHAKLSIYDVRGRLVQTLIDEMRPAGLNEINWQGRDAQGRAVASGTYFMYLKAAEQTDVKSMTLVR